jgi:hypothetical protein
MLGDNTTRVLKNTTHCVQNSTTGTQLQEAHSSPHGYLHGNRIYYLSGLQHDK